MSKLDTSRLRDAIASLRDSELRVFGADIHGFLLNPPLPDVQVATFEKIHNVSLPHDFKLFLTDVGNGGAGPFYGLFPLGEMDDNFGLRTWQEDDGLVGVLSEPFPLNKEWNDISSLPPADLTDRNESEYDEQMDRFDRMYWRTSLVNGAIPICHQGCAQRIWLVVTGAQAGYLWEDKRSEYEGLRPLLLADGSPATFTAWYEAWLNDCLKCDMNHCPPP